jgi:hypothetical protein
MSLVSRSHRLIVLASLTTIVLSAWVLRSRVEQWTRASLAVRHQHRLAQLSDEGAVLLISRLAEADDEYLDLIVLALQDRRPRVASAAEQALAARVERWSRWPKAEALPRVAALASLLSESAERIPLERRPALHRLAERLLAWPADGQLIDGHRLIVDCEKLLRLPLPAAAIRISYE